jgi:hypothetical protein
MSGLPTDTWEHELESWLEPFLARLRRKAQRHWAPFYLKGLILPGERKSIEPMAARVAPADTQQLHHFVSTSPWATAPVEDELVKAADRLVGGQDAVLVVDDTALVKQGRHSVGVKRQYCGQLGKRANCQVLVSLTLARAEVPIGIGLRPRSRCDQACPRTGVLTVRDVRLWAYPRRSATVRSGGSLWMRLTVCWAQGLASAAYWPMPSTARQPSSAPGLPSGGSAMQWASCRPRRSIPLT